MRYTATSRILGSGLALLIAGAAALPASAAATNPRCRAARGHFLTQEHRIGKKRYQVRHGRRRG